MVVPVDAQNFEVKLYLDRDLPVEKFLSFAVTLLPRVSRSESLPVVSMPVDLKIWECIQPIPIFLALGVQDVGARITETLSFQRLTQNALVFKGFQSMPKDVEVKYDPANWRCDIKANLTGAGNQTMAFHALFRSPKNNLEVAVPIQIGYYGVKKTGTPERIEP